MNLKDLTDGVISLVYEVGEFIRHENLHFNQQHIEYKGVNDLVSYVDKTAEQKIVKKLQELLPEAGFITEEKTINKKGEAFNWIVDPLDGTTNFIHGIPAFSISIALQQDNELVLGVVYEINRDECFSAWKNGGAYLNGNKISVSGNETVEKSLLATGFPFYNFDKLELYINLFRELTQRCQGLRRIGSAAVDLAYTACGRFDGYFEYNINLWDIAAGIVLVREAGGEVVNFTGEEEFPVSREVVATNGKIAGSLLSIVQKHFNKKSD
ncbi:inositol monophosphatase family protein [Rubrolithibacter danxiaensis]|uniref:inositol monophosphatase family protein n=1 Tax=Rubrolithibacter danxiaensis TaxID=3390805 RepID=UPI003BF8DE01